MIVKNKILIVCNWPLGGIRTYLKYVYGYFPKERYDITLLARFNHESQSIVEDMNKIGVKVIWAKPVFKFNLLFYRIWQVLRKNDFDIIHSQGFISASHSSIANVFKRAHHVLTIHGILEDKYFQGLLGNTKRLALKILLMGVDTFHGVGEDILNHFHSHYPSFKSQKYRNIVIRNGILSEQFNKPTEPSNGELFERFSIDKGKVKFGFFGRFMPEKGFEYIIEAVKILSTQNQISDRFIVLCVGSGDYKKDYIQKIKQYELDDYFNFIPFQSNIAPFIKICQAVLMPSVCEAYPMQSSEVLCSGIPLIASDCIGLREATENTPAIKIHSKDISALADAMTKIIQEPEIVNEFIEYQIVASKRFHVEPLARKLVEYFDGLRD